MASISKTRVCWLKATFALLAVLAFVPGAFARETPLPPDIEKITSVEGITEYRLKNGLKLLLL
jgi:hypothetical protein